MRKHLSLTITLLILVAIPILAQSEAEVITPEKNIEWFQVIVTVGYLLGVFLLLPLVIYSNLKEKIAAPGDKDQKDIKPVEYVNKNDRNQEASMILDHLIENLTPFVSEDGENQVTINKGKQARLVKNGLEYINTRLQPNDSEIIERIEELTLVYNERAKRAFTGSKWIIICSAGIGVLFAVTGGITTFLFLHLLGLLFYILSSRTPIYVLEKRMDLFGSWGGGMVSAIFEGLFVGAATKHYNVYSDGRRERDHSSEFLGGMAYFLIGFVIAMFLGVLAAVLGVVNFFLNYSTSYHMPFKSLDSWYTKEFDN